MSLSPTSIRSSWDHEDNYSPKERKIKPKQCKAENTPSLLCSMQSIEVHGGLSGNNSTVELFDMYNSKYIIEQTNLIDQPWKDEDKVVAFMRARYLSKQFYTWAGQTLLAVHPYEEQRMHETAASSNQPSINALVSKAWIMLSRNLGKLDHAIVITGESGSGKTYSACLAMKFIAKKEHQSFDNILWQVWSSVPLLAAFGNAATAHNRNSSRFGKLLQLQYANGRIQGAFIKTFMLEKSRVTGPNYGDGNFHIFRQILESLDEESLNCLQLDRSIEYKIVPRVVLRSSYADTVKSLEILNITELDKILTILSIILNLGNITFQLRGDVCGITYESIQFAENVAVLLRVTTKELIDILCNIQFCPKSTTRRNSIYKSACMNKEECEERRNSLMKFLYNNLFNWLVQSINSRICSEGSLKHLGLLDVYGFEIFDHNTFEQLCINYANERLQQHFMVHYIHDKRDELIYEGLSIDTIDISEYSRRISIIDGPSSIFGILNEECMVKRFNNDLFVNARLVETLRGRNHFIGPLNDLNTTFSIVHYAGVVKYDTKSMLQKNRDKVPDDIFNFVRTCRFDFLKQLIVDPSDNGKTLITNFKKSLDELMQSLKESEVHYIKCLKPNPYKISEFFDEDFFKKQLATNGIFELLKLSFQKYSIKLNFQKFISHFSKPLYHNLKQILESDIFVGKTNIYLTESAYYMFEKLQYIKMSTLVRKIQLQWFRYHGKRTRAAVVIQRFFRNVVSRRQQVVYDKFIDLSKKSSEMCMYKDSELRGIRKLSPRKKIEQYLGKHRFDVNFEGDQLSLMLENIYNNVETKPFKRVLFCGDRIISFNRLAEIPVRFHTSKTCMRYSYLLPKAELPKGLSDIF